MIIDKIMYSQQYKNISARITKGLEFLEENDLKSMEIGRYEIDGINLFALVQEYTPKNIEEGKCEAHKKYIDIQYIVSGKEQMGYLPLNKADVKLTYNEAKDCEYFHWNGDMITFEEGSFAIFFPQDAHMPSIKTDGCDSVKKVVVKVAID